LLGRETAEQTDEANLVGKSQAVVVAATLAEGDRLVVSELSRLGRSLGQVIQIVDELVKRKVRFTAIKEAIRFEGR
jgi:hypothetical protein